MRHLFPTQWSVPDAPGNYRADASGKRAGAQSHEAAPERGLPAPPRGYSSRVGYRLESAPRGSESPVSCVGCGNPAAFSQPSTARTHGRASTAMKFTALAFIRFYQACISPVLPSSCRFYPSCSAYACEAVEKWGPWQGIGLALRRLLRCCPFGGRGYDPVP